jgi:hypothetical protein
MTEIMGLKTIKVSDQNHKELGRLGAWNETMDDIIGKCIEAYKKVNKL